jgi:hypothetical protein
MYNAPNGPLQCKRCQRFGHTQRNCGYAPRCVACGEEHPSGNCVTPKQQFKCCSWGGNHTASYRGCSKWKKQRRLLQSNRNGSAAERMASPRACQHLNQLQLSLLANRRNLALAETTMSEAAASSRLRLRPVLHPLHPTQEHGPRVRLPQRAINLSPLVLKSRWLNPSHPVPNSQTRHPLSHRVSFH